MATFGKMGLLMVCRRNNNYAHNVIIVEIYQL